MRHNDLERRYNSIHALSNIVPTRLIAPSPAIPLGLCKVPLQHVRDCVTNECISVIIIILIIILKLQGRPHIVLAVETAYLVLFVRVSVEI